MSSDYSPPGTFSDLCLKGCSHWHKATWPWPDRADSIDSACHLHLQNGPCVLWDFTSPCIAPLRHPGLGSVLPQPLPGLSPWPQQLWPAPRRQQPEERGWRAGGAVAWTGVCPLPGRHCRATAQLRRSSGTGVAGGNGGFHRLGRVLSQVSGRTMSLLCAGRANLLWTISAPQAGGGAASCPEQRAVRSRERW